MTGWQPIETAPKDGTPVLLYSPHGDGTDPTNVIVGKWETFGKEAAWWGYCENVLADICGQIEPEPSHWQPLPPPPETGT